MGVAKQNDEALLRWSFASYVRGVCLLLQGDLLKQLDYNQQHWHGNKSNVELRINKQIKLRTDEVLNYW